MTNDYPVENLRMAEPQVILMKCHGNCMKE